MRSLFFSLCQALGCNGNMHIAYEKMIRQYHSPMRYYHTFDGHIYSCIQEFMFLQKSTEYYHEIGLALFFHDAIMNFNASDNEQRSADFASETLVEIGISNPVIKTVTELILATKHDAAPSSQAEKYIIDIDLAIFGQNSEIFDAYEKNIRKEYAFVAQEEFCHRRAAILQQFLDRPSIYSSEEFFERYEKTARENLCRSIAKLQ